MASKLLEGIRSVYQNPAGKSLLITVSGIAAGHFVFLPILKRVSGLHELQVLMAEEEKTNAKLQAIHEDFDKERYGYMWEIAKLSNRLDLLRKQNNSRDVGESGIPAN